MVDMECEHRHDSGGVQPVKIVAGNKCDLKEARQVSSRQGLEWARGRDCGFMETSAREMVNIEETFARKFLFNILIRIGRWNAGGWVWAGCRQNLFQCMLMPDIVIVRRVVAARRLHASGATPIAPRSGLQMHSTSHTQPLTPLEEKAGGVDFSERPGRRTKRGGFWARFRCW